MLYGANSQQPTANSRRIISVCVMVMFFVSAFISSCNYTTPNHPGYEFMPDMYRSPSYETNSINPLFADSMTDRLPVAGTVPRGDYLPYPYPATNDGYEAAG